MVVSDLKELVALRNQAARKLGFKNYHAMQLYCGEQSEEQVLKLFDELDELTRKPFHQAKAEIDAALAKQLRHHASPSFARGTTTIRFSRRSRPCWASCPKSVYKPLDTVKMCREFYDGIGLPIDDVLARSDLYEQPGKNPARLLDRHRPPGRYPHSGEHRARPRMAEHHAARVGPRRILEKRAAAACPTCCAPTPIRFAPRAWP